MYLRDIIAAWCCLACLVLGMIVGSVVTESRLYVEIEDELARIEMEERD